MKDRMGNMKVASLGHRAAPSGATSDLILTEVDVGSARNAIMILAYYAPAAASDMGDVQVFSNHAATVLTSTASGAASDLVTIVQDTEPTNSTSDLTISSNVISSVKIGTYTLYLKNLRRYVNVQYNGTGTGSRITCHIIAYDAMKQPYDSDIMDPTF